jgi:hypothetical protein
MKICWDNLEELRYNKKIGKWYKGNTTYIYKGKCETCGEPFLAQKQSKGKYCCFNCRKISLETRGKMSKAHSGKNHYSWNGGYYRKNIPFYDTYESQIEWCEKVRRNEEDSNILEVKCFKCDEWFIPKIWQVRNRIVALKGMSENHFYCSKGCRNSCSIYHKTPEQLMKEDAIRAGRLGWLELNREVQPELRKMVLERDGYQCVKCGSKGPLHCHHIYPVSTNPIESADIDNCMTLCIDCHKESHKIPGCSTGELSNLC